MSGHGTIDTAVEATRFGAFDFLEKPIALQKLLSTVQKALKHDKAPARPALTLEAFSRLAFVKEFKRRMEQALAKSSILLLKERVVEWLKYVPARCNCRAHHGWISPA
jgi:DNA-binding NtrC family response regulator